jgi:hypothetical protein
VNVELHLFKHPSLGDAIRLITVMTGPLELVSPKDVKLLVAAMKEKKTGTGEAPQDMTEEEYKHQLQPFHVEKKIKLQTPASTRPPDTYTDVVVDTVSQADINELMRPMDRQRYGCLSDNLINDLIMTQCGPVADGHVAIMSANLMNFLCNTTTEYDDAIASDNPNDALDAKVDYLYKEYLSLYGTGVGSDKVRRSFLLDKKYVFFVCNSKDIAEAKRNRDEPQPEHWVLYLAEGFAIKEAISPVLFFIDSYFKCEPPYQLERNTVPMSHHLRNMRMLKRWLTLHTDQWGTSTQAVSKMRGVTVLRIPQQMPFSNACGYYIVTFMQLFMQLPEHQRLQFMTKARSSKNDNGSLFVAFESEFRTLINETTYPKIYAAMVERYTQRFNAEATLIN